MPLVYWGLLINVMKRAKPKESIHTQETASLSLENYMSMAQWLQPRYNFGYQPSEALTGTPGIPGTPGTFGAVRVPRHVLGAVPQLQRGRLAIVAVHVGQDVQQHRGHASPGAQPEALHRETTVEPPALGGVKPTDTPETPETS